MPCESPATFRTLDGLRLRGTLVTPDGAPERAAVLVHGGGVTREEGGLLSRMAAGLAEAQVASLRFDLRGHGESEGRQEELTLSAILNDIRVALAHARETTGAHRVSLIGQSFGGGICGYYAAKRPGEADRLVLLCPQFDRRPGRPAPRRSRPDHFPPAGRSRYTPMTAPQPRRTVDEEVNAPRPVPPKRRPGHCPLQGTPA
jgi:alpha-beta hydrolase superfamily lysophospholipase